MMTPGVPQISEARFERKFLVSGLSRYEIEAIIKLHPAMFHEPYPRRFVNNLYLDSQAAKNYFTTINGQSERVKLRIRWYGDLFGLVEKPVLELKTKTGSVGRKAGYPLHPFMLDETFRPVRLTNVFLASDLPDMLRESLMSMEIWLLNRYQRQYFQTVDRRYRLTIDWQMEYYRTLSMGDGFHAKAVDTSCTIVELKYRCSDQEGADIIASHFPFRMSKNSKYVQGLHRLYS